MKLAAEFEKLAGLIEQLIALLEESGDKFWVTYMRRGLVKVREHKLAGATFVLGCYNGMDTFSDLELAQDLREQDPLAHSNLNARLTHLRTAIFKSANLIAGRSLW